MSELIVIGKQHHDEDRPLNCGVCGARFRLDQMEVYDRHVFRCANSETAEAMQAMSPRRVFPFLNPKLHGDVEYGEWFRARRRAILERRIKP